MLSFLNSLPGAVAQGLVWGIMAIGVYVTYKILDYADLTVDGSFCTGGAVAAMLIVGGMNPTLALFFAFLAGALAGLMTGILHTSFGIPAILSGILSQLALYSINLRIMGGKSNVSISRTRYSLLLTSFENYSAIGVGLCCVGIVTLLLYWFFGTELGSALRATGNNAHMARAQGINTNRMKVLGLVLSNGIVGFGGGVLAQFQGNADVSMGRGAIVIGLAAVVIGEVSFGWIRNFSARLLGTAFGAIVYYIVITIVLRLGFPSSDMKLFSALTVAIFLTVPYWKGKLLRFRSYNSKKPEKRNEGGVKDEC